MKVAVTGSSSGIGRSVARLFLERGQEVVGIDLKDATIEHPSYTHHVADISKAETLPELKDIQVLVNSAGVQDSEDDIAVNLKGTINVTEKYGFTPAIKAILIIASASAHSGAEFPCYSASKGGLLAYTRNVAIRLAPKGAVCNSISPGGVETDLNKPVMEDQELWQKIMDVTPLKKWAKPEEIAEWVWFLTMVNRSASGEDFLIDNGEAHLNASFVWPEK